MKQLKVSIRLFKILVCLPLMVIISKQAYSQADSVIKNVTWTSGTHEVSIAGEIISPDTSSRPVEILDSAHVDFISGTAVILNPGFDAGSLASVGYYDARINLCNLLQVTTTATNVACYGGSNGGATATASGGTTPYSYLWSPSGGTTSSASGLSAGTYTITVTDAHSCIVIAIDTITQPSALAATVAMVNTTCAGDSNGSATVSISGGVTPYTYLWSPSGGTNSAVTSRAAGTYTVTITDAHGCTLTDSATILNPFLVLSCTVTTDSATLFLSSPHNIASYSWSTGSTTSSIKVIRDTIVTYYLTAVDSNSCTMYDSITIYPPFTYSQQTSGVNRQWAASIGHLDSLSIVRITHDSQGNVILAGCTIDSATGPDVLVAKYSPSGSLLWQQTYSGSGSFRDEATAVAVDDSDNIYVAGATGISDSNFHYVTIKYDSIGDQKWMQTYVGTLDTISIATAIVVNQNYVYVTGGASDTTTLLDYTTIQYNRHTGVQNWVRNYDQAHLLDGALAMTLDNSNGGVVVTGRSQDSFTDLDYATVYYDSIGNQLNVKIASGTTSGLDRALGVVKTGNDGSTYVTGGVANATTGFDIKTVKYDSTDAQLWAVSFDYQGGTDIGTDLLVDSSGNVYVCGYGQSLTTGYDYLLIKYNSSGTQLWKQSFDGAGLNDSAAKMTFDSYGDIIVTGQSQTADSNYNFLTLAYHPDSTLFWKDFYHGCSGNSRAMDITADSSGDVYVSGTSFDCSRQVYADVAVKYNFTYYVAPPDTQTSSSNMLFYPNYGQTVDDSNKVRPDVYDYTVNQSPMLFFDTVGVSFAFESIHKDTTIADTLERIDMQFVQPVSDEEVSGNITRPYETAIQDNGFLNYFLAQCPNGITGVKGAETLIQKNVYTNIDIMYANNNAGMKFYIIVNPGGDMTGKLLYFTGQQSVSIDGSGALHVNGMLGSVVYNKPEVYQVDNSNARIDLPATCSYTYAGSYIGFTVGHYNNSLPFIIEMSRVTYPTFQANNEPEWSTFLGGTGDDESTSVTVDKEGNPYFTGFTSSNNFPYTVGAIQITNHGNFDAFVAKFGSANGASYALVPLADQQLWTTYYGGSGDDEANSITTSETLAVAMLYITGFTESADFPTHNNAGIFCQTTLSGTQDAFIVGLDLASGGENGVWATYFGGSGEEIGNAIKTDGAGNIYCGGSTTTSAYTANTCIVPTDGGFPKCNTSSSFNNDNAFGGDIDGFISMFNSSGTLLWSSFYGGPGIDQINALAIDGNNNLYMTGSTASSTGFPIVSLTGAYNQGTLTSVGGNGDAFISRFTSSGVNDWCSYFGGNGDDAGLAIVTDNISNNVYIAGLTSSETPPCTTTCLCTVPPAGDFPLCNPTGAYFQGTGSLGVYGGGTSDGFIAKFDDNGVFTWGTYYGGSGADRINGLAVDYDNRIFFAGQTFSPGSSANLIAQGAMYGWYLYQNTLWGTSNGFLGNFSTNECSGEVDCRYWATYYGQDEGASTMNTKINSIAAYGSGPNNNSTNDFWYIAGATTTPFGSFQVWYDNECCPKAYQQTNQYNTFETNAILARFSLNAPLVLSVEDISSPDLSGVLVYPNPFSNIISISMDLPELTNVTVSAYSITGQLLYEQAYGRREGKFLAQVDFTNFANGIYLLQIRTDKNVVNKRIIKHK